MDFAAAVSFIVPSHGLIAVVSGLAILGLAYDVYRQVKTPRAAKPRSFTDLAGIEDALVAHRIVLAARA